MAYGLHHVGRIVGGRAVDAKPDGDARRLELLHRADAHAERHVGGGAMADADARFPQALDLARVEMDPVRDPGPGTEPPGLIQEIDRARAESLEGINVLVE